MKMALKSTMLVVALGLLWAAGVNAALVNPPPQGFSMVGFIQEARLDPTVGASTPIDHRLWGGYLTINGIKMVVPNNTIVQMPAGAFTWEQLFDPAISATVPAGKINIRPGQTGLALADNPLAGTRSGSFAAGTVPFPSFEATVSGNILPDGRYVVGLIAPISQQSLNSLSGIINFIDYDGTVLPGHVPGRFRVGGIAGNAATGVLCEINDPVARYGVAHSPDPRFTSDTNNPTITTITGYPVGIPTVAPPADDPLRPVSTQRPLNGDIRFGTDPFLTNGSPLRTFTMPVTGTAGGPEPTVQVPLMVGDWIDAVGTLYKINPLGANTAANMYVSIHTLNADLGIYTTPGTLANPSPTYVNCNVLEIGTDGLNGPVDLPVTAGNPSTTIPEEYASRTHVEGFCTNAGTIAGNFGSATVTVYALQVNPDGSQTQIKVPGPNGTRGNPASVEAIPLGRWRYQTSAPGNTPGNPIPLTREYRVVHSDGVFPTPVCNGLTAGSFDLPMFGFLFPEHTTLGNPQVPLNFQDLAFLAVGGPVSVPGGALTTGRLDPWPGP